jgi:hypothetical protein
MNLHTVIHMHDHHTGRIRRVLPIAIAALAMVFAGTAQAQEWRSVTSARQVHDRSPLDVQIRYGAGQLTLEPADEPMLYQMNLRYDQRQFTPVTEYDAEKRLLRLGTEGRDQRRGRMNVRDGGNADIALSRVVPMDLQLQFGAGEANIDLGGVSLRRVSLSTGASETRVRFSRPNPIEAHQVTMESGAASLEVIGLANTRAERFIFQGGVGSTTLDFSGTWRRSATASVQMGIGSVIIRVPRGIGVKVSRNSFLTSFDSEGLTKRGNNFFSPDWESATHTLDISVNAALGSIKIEWID